MPIVLYLFNTLELLSRIDDEALPAQDLALVAHPVILTHRRAPGTPGIAARDRSARPGRWPAPAPHAPPRRPCRAGSPCGPASRPAVGCGSRRRGTPIERSFLRTRLRAAASSSSGSISASASRAMSSSMPLRRSSSASARRARPLPPPSAERRDEIQARANARRRPGRPPRSGRAGGWRFVGHQLARQLVGQLLATAGLAGQLVEQDLAGHRLRVGIGSVGERVGWHGIRHGPAEPGVDPSVASPARTGRRANRSSEGVDPGGLDDGFGLGVELRADAELLLDLLLDLVGEVGVVLEEAAGVLLALAELVALVGVPGAGLADEPCSTPMSIRPPSRLMPLPYMMSNSACLNGGATLFFTTLTRVRLPTASVPSLRVSMRRTSSRTEA